MSYFTQQIFTTIENLLKGPVEAGDLDSIIEAVGFAAEIRDAMARGHGERVAKYTYNLAWIAGLNIDDKYNGYTAGLYHDIGKIAVSSDILSKKEPLTDEERGSIMIHPVVGEELLALIPKFRPLAKIIRHHHEQYNGSGYPDGLKGEEIPLLSRIISICDTYDCLTTNRSFRSALSQKRALDILRQNKGPQWDEHLVNLFIKNIDTFPIKVTGGYKSSWNFENFFDLVPCFKILSSFSGEIFNVNAAFLKTFGYSFKEVVGSNVRDFVHPDDVSQGVQTIIGTIKENPISEYKNRIRKKDGSYVVVRWLTLIASDEQIFYTAGNEIR